MSNQRLNQIESEIQRLKQEAEEIINRERKEALQNVKNTIRTFGFTTKELGFSGDKTPVKYKLGSSSWSGRGRKPQWVLDYEAQGKSLQDLKV